MSLKRRLLFGIGVGLSMALSGAVHAQDSESRTFKVSYRDLDISTAQGLSSLRGRIKTASHLVCDEPSVRDVATMSRSFACRKAAIADSEVQIAHAKASGKQLANGEMTVRIASR